MCTLLETKTRLRAGYGVSTNESDAAQRLWRRWRWRRGLRTPPPLVSDSFGGHRDALLSVFGVPQTKQPKARLQAGKDWQYVQLHKVLDHYRRVIRVYPRIIWGADHQAAQALKLNTAYVERTHLSSRLMNARLVRKTLGFSKTAHMLIASVIWGDLVYNLVRPLKSLRLPLPFGKRRWQHRSPAMAAGLTHHLWSFAELLWTLPVPTNT